MVDTQSSSVSHFRRNPFGQRGTTVKVGFTLAAREPSARPPRIGGVKPPAEGAPHKGGALVRAGTLDSKGGTLRPIQLN